LRNFSAPPVPVACCRNAYPAAPVGKGAALLRGSRLRHLALHAGIGLVGAFAGTAALAQSVALTGVMGERALLVIDGAAPQVVAAGESRLGVTLVSTDGDTAIVELSGHRQTLRVGENPVSVGGRGGGGSGSRVTLYAGSGGHFLGTAQFNGVTLPFVIDTGASNVVMGIAQAEQIGLDYRAGTRSAVTTANGITPAWQVKLNSVRLGDIEIYNVTATIVPAGAPVVLLGNSFLGRFQMKQENDQLVLEKRY
jgi:aspartyl protease family protein